MAGVKQRAMIDVRDEAPGDFADDAAVVRRAHVAHRAELLDGADLPADSFARLLAQQHEFQERHIAIHHPRADRLMLIESGTAAGTPAVGRVVIDRTGSPWQLVDIAIVPEAQGRGIGATTIGQLQRDAATARVAIELHVMHANTRAAALYRRLGFVDAIAASDSHARMIWTPTPGRHACVN